QSRTFAAPQAAEIWEARGIPEERFRCKSQNCPANALDRIADVVIVRDPISSKTRKFRANTLRGKRRGQSQLRGSVPVNRGMGRRLASLFASGGGHVRGMFH